MSALPKPRYTRRPPLRLRGRVHLAYNLFLNSMPKSGTFFAVGALGELFGARLLSIVKRDISLAEALLLGTGRHAMYGHFRHAPEVREILSPARLKMVVLIRDPRDVVLSKRDFLERSLNKDHIARYGAIAHLSRDEQIKALIRGFGAHDDVSSIERHASGWLAWQQEGAHLFRYEDFWSEPGLDALASFLDVDAGKLKRAVALAQGRSSPTLNKAVRTRWPGEMDANLLAYFRAHDGGCVEALGYSWD